MKIELLNWIKYMEKDIIIIILSQIINNPNIFILRIFLNFKILRQIIIILNFNKIYKFNNCNKLIFLKRMRIPKYWKLAKN